RRLYHDSPTQNCALAGCQPVLEPRRVGTGLVAPRPTPPVVGGARWHPRFAPWRPVAPPPCSVAPPGTLGRREALHGSRNYGNGPPLAPIPRYSGARGPGMRGCVCVYWRAAQGNPAPSPQPLSPEYGGEGLPSRPPSPRYSGQRGASNHPLPLIAP